VSRGPLDRQIIERDSGPMLDNLRNVAQVEGRRQLVQPYVGRAEPGLPMVHIPAEPRRRLARVTKQLASRGTVLPSGRRDGRAQEQHPEQAQRILVARLDLVRQPCGGGLTELHRVVEATNRQQRMRTRPSRRRQDERVIRLIRGVHRPLSRNPCQVGFADLRHR